MTKPQTRKEYLIQHKNDPKYSKLLRPLRRDGRDLKPYALMTMEEKYAYNDIYTIGYLDIETSNLQADFGFMLSWSLLVRDLETGEMKLIHDFVTRKDYDFAERNKDRDLKDKRILKSLIKAMADCDCFIGHWFIGKHRHDIPYIRTRCAINKISGFPKHKMVRYGDTQKWGSQIHRLRSFGLAAMADAFQISTQKTPIQTKTWKNAMDFAFKKDISYIVDHNDKDVIITDQVHRHIEEYVPIPSTYA